MDADLVTIDGGISIPSYNEIREAIGEDLRGVFGDELAIESGTPDGMTVDVFAAAWHTLAEKLQTAVSNLDPSTATSAALDILANLLVGGRNDGETDEELRARLLSADTSGYATYDTMLTYLQSAIASGVAMDVNDEPDEADGVPGHSFVVYVPTSASGVSDDTVAAAIWFCKPAGIKAEWLTTADTDDDDICCSGTATDAAGRSQTVRFMRIAETAYTVHVYITEYDEETLPDDYEDQISAAIATWAESEFTAGKDIIWARFALPVYSVPGVLSFTVKLLNGDGEWEDVPTRTSIPANECVVLTVDGVTLEEE